jgi:hypothetical protein
LKKYEYIHSSQRKNMHDFKRITTRGGKRPGAGRPSEGKERVTITLNADNVSEAKAREKNFSGLLDRLLSEWLGKKGH